MGMYDSVKIRCPKCNKINEDVQSKAGECGLNVYPNLDSAPLSIVADLAEASEKGRVRCEHCNATIMIKVAIASIRLYETEIEQPDADSPDGEYYR